jgi:hypothetical protein
MKDFRIKTFDKSAELTHPTIAPLGTLSSPAAERGEFFFVILSTCICFQIIALKMTGLSENFGV